MLPIFLWSCEDFTIKALPVEFNYNAGRIHSFDLIPYTFTAKERALMEQIFKGVQIF